MKRKKGSTTGRLSLGFFGVVFLAGVALLPTCADAQSQGNNAVYHYVSITNKGQCCKGSSAFIDASVFVSNATTFCGVLNYMLTPINGVVPSTGAVIDARGLANSSPATSMTCTTANPSPWAGITNPPPSTILLPATGGTTPTPIIIPSSWVLPNNTRLIGQGDGVTSGAAPIVTQLSDATLAMYIVGEPILAGSTVIGYSRFTTSESIPAWLVGSSSPGTSSCAIGSLYSETSGTSGTLWGCRGSSGVGSWHDFN
jgi:hypothetical protein